jgi:Domain of unknown function (DUF6249)
MDPELAGMIPFVALLIPIIAIILSVAIGMLALFLNYRRRHEMFQLYHKERLAAIDKGLDLPPIPEHFFNDVAKPASPHRALLKGLIFTLGGVGVFVALYAYHPEVALYALIPVGVGLAFLIYYFAVGRKQAQAVQAKEPPELAPSPAAGQ